ncbi:MULTISPECIES: type II secretion system protein [Synechocystis]|uniref:Type II secretion system protein n=1 Tax=Synechocystis salina LEGE 00031 TaxID=1828736 RepID=A0ABR9VT79_9SYNC|nr:MULTISPECIES: type II secretion system protein [Synechocystis]MBE9195050.1 type II secretion system protein [Synechocystis sp. LEGE 06083]MBE9241091.1 type II secretion system protein [Synechocystis salina LEGE 00041]MBE9254557.1 type II secretion system protein [Synechocystis salina LEGE 00031]
MFKPTKKGLPNAGFTMLELVVVFLILSILTAMVWPVLIRQVAKAKETEAIQMLSTIGFSQQGYFFEHRQFASNYGDLGLDANGAHFNFPPPNTPAGGNYSISQAVTQNAGLDASRNYSLGVYFNGSSYQLILCQGSTPGGAVSAPSAIGGTCSGGVQID